MLVFIGRQRMLAVRHSLYQITALRPQRWDVVNSAAFRLLSDDSKLVRETHDSENANKYKRSREKQYLRLPHKHLYS